MGKQTFISIPTEIQAEQWFPGKQVEGVTERFYTHPNNNTKRSSGYGTCITIHGQETSVDPGDWIITEPDGIHHYPCKPDVFAKRYRLKESTDE
jgi:hypothetical protein